MSETGDGAKIVQAFREHRPYLIDLAFRMLGDIGAAEQYLRLRVVPERSNHLSRNR